MIILIDNYDSFSYNLYQLIGKFEHNLKVVRNDEVTIRDIENLNPEAVIISPGPGKPSKAGICEEVIKYFAWEKPILGICLGHQAICEAFGGEIIYAPKIMHGKTSEININTDCTLFKNLPNRIEVARYHSLIADASNMPKELLTIGKTDDNIIMAIKHKDYKIYGLQFHPESVLTPDGEKIAENFIKEVCRK